jgi:hypothetical protein
MPRSKVAQERAAVQRLLNATVIGEVQQFVHPSAAGVTHLLGEELTPKQRRSLGVLDDSVKIEFVICRPLDLDTPLLHEDNVRARCADCGRQIQHRPHAPIKRAPTVCVVCADRRISGTPA